MNYMLFTLSENKSDVQNKRSDDELSVITVDHIMCFVVSNYPITLNRVN